MWGFVCTWLSYERGKAAGLPGLIAIILFILFCYSFNDMLPIYLWLQLDEVMKFFNVLQSDGFHLEVLLFGLIKMCISFVLIGTALIIFFMVLTVLYMAVWKVFDRDWWRKKKIEKLNYEGIYYIPEKEKNVKEKKHKVSYAHPIGRNKMAVTKKRRFL